MCRVKGKILLIFFLFLNSLIYSQSFVKNEKNSMLIGLALSPILSDINSGLSIEFNTLISNNYFSGLYFFSNSNTTNDTFGYNIKQPIVNFLEIGWNNGIQFYNKKRIKLSASLSNNICFVRLGDNSEKRSIFTGKVLATTSKEIHTDFLYSLVPNIGASLQIYSTLFLSTNIKYRQTFGSSFTSQTSFSGFVYCVGLTFFID